MKKFFLLILTLSFATFVFSQDKKEGLKRIGNENASSGFAFIINTAVFESLKGLEGLAGLEGLEGLKALESLESLESLAELSALESLEVLESLDLDFDFDYDQDYDIDIDIDTDLDIDVHEIIDDAMKSVRDIKRIKKID